MATIKLQCASGSVRRVHTAKIVNGTGCLSRPAQGSRTGRVTRPWAVLAVKLGSTGLSCLSGVSWAAEGVCSS